MKKNKKSKKRKLLPILILLVILSIIGYIGIRYYLYIQTIEFKLKDIGYSKEEITTIKTELKDEEIKPLLEKEYNSNIVKFITQKYFIYSNLDRYQNYYNKNPEKSVEEVITMVNVEADSAFYSNIKNTDTTKGNLILVNKTYKLPNDYQVGDLKSIDLEFANEGHKLVEDAYNHYIEMAKAAKKEGLNLLVTSSYRDYNFQNNLYNNYIKEHGKEEADTFSARPGHSEHQTGLAIDIVTKDSDFDSFEDTDEFEWLLENSYKYGFILRYPEEKEHITGYKYEPWHYRYVGVEYAKKIYDEGITFDEYYAYYLK